MEDERKTKKQLIEELNCLRLEKIDQTRITSEKFTKAFLHNAIPLTITSAKEGRVVEASDAFLRLVGRKRHEVIGQTAIEGGFITKEQRADFFAELKKSGRIENFEMEIRPSGGTLIHGLFNAVMMNINNENYLLTTIQDITDRKQALHELETHQIELTMQNEKLHRAQVEVETIRAKYFDLYNLAPVGYVTVSEKGLILEGNLTVTTLLDVTEQDLLKKHLSRFIIPEDADIYYLLSKQLFKTGNPQKCELRMVKKDGTAFWAYLDATTTKNADGVSVSHVTINDITKHKQAEEALRESEKKYRWVVDNIADVISVGDMNYRLTYLSPSIIRLRGVTPEEAMAQSIEEYVSPDSLRIIANKMEEEMKLEASGTADPGRTGYLEMEQYRKDGSTILVELSYSFMRDAEQKPVGIITVSRDITARRQAEARKAALEAQNRQLQKSESLGRMAASIAHHFNNQLGVVIGNLEMAIDDQPKGAPPSKSLASAMQAAWKSADMSGLMLTYLGQTHNEQESLDLSYFCRKILPLIKTTLPVNVVMETDFPLPRPIIMANSGEIQQILTNLIANASESIGNNAGSISLSVKTVSPIDIPTQNRFPVDWESLGKTFACLEVTDTGCGIEEKDMEKLFDPFYSTKFTGRGMGLPVVLGLANSHKGVITVESKPGSGSTFRLFFPVSEEAMTQPQMTDSDRDITISKSSSKKLEEGGTVLVVEDEEMLRDMAAAMLASSGFTVLKAKDGIEALEIFGKHQSEIKFVLTDLTMPRMNGWETLTALRKLKSDIPVILASGYDLAHVMEGDHPELPQAFLAKPYNLKALRAAISQATESRKN